MQSIKFVKICFIYTYTFTHSSLSSLLFFSLESLPLFFFILQNTNISFLTQYPISYPTPHIEVRALLIKFLFFKSLCDACCPLSTSPSFRCHKQRSRKRHALAFIFNLVTHILHPFSSFKVNKNKFQDFFKVSLLFSHESAEMSNSHTFDES